MRSLFLAFFAIWLFFSIWSQLLIVKGPAARQQRYKRFKWDYLGLIPLWCLWTDPASWDSVLLYRDKLCDGRLTSWKSAWAISANPFRGIWSPQSRKARVIHSWLPLLLAVAEGKKQPEECSLSRAYVSAAIYISGLQSKDAIESRQFMVARVSGFNRETPAEILFVSPLFRMEAVL